MKVFIRVRNILVLSALTLLTSCSLFGGEQSKATKEDWRQAFEQGFQARTKKDWAGAKEQYLRALELARAGRADDETRAEIFTELAYVQGKERQWLKSDKSLRQAQEIYEELWVPDRGGVNNRDHAINLSKVLLSRARVLLKIGDCRAALKAIKKALKTADEAPAPDYLKGDIMQTQALVLSKLGRAQEAEHLRDGATIFEATMDERRINSEKTSWQKLLDEADRALGALDYEYAEKAYNEALESFRAGRPDRFGEARALSGLATIYDARKDYSQAQSCLLRSNSILDKGKPGEAKTKLKIENMHRLAKVQLHAGNLVSAEKNVRLAIELEKKAADPAGMRRNQRKLMAALVDILEAEKKYREAEELTKEKLDMERKFYGDDSPKLAENYGRLARLAALDGRLNESSEYYEKSIAAFERQSTWHPQEKIDVLEAYVRHLRAVASGTKRERELTAKLEAEKLQIKKLLDSD